jgi:uncharacterized integral membrane protein
VGIAILVVFLLIGGIATFIAMSNLTPPVHLGVFSWHTPDLPLGLWLIAAFLCGAILLYLVALISTLGDRRRMKALRKQVLALQEQVTTLSQANSPSPQSTEGDKFSTANTAPISRIPSTTNTPQSNGRKPTSPLSPQTNFRG